MNKTTEKTVVINNFRIGSEIKKKLEEIAEREQRTFAGQIRLAKGILLSKLRGKVRRKKNRMRGLQTYNSRFIKCGVH
jgi:hypothetical protein